MDAPGTLHFEPWRPSLLERVSVWLTWAVAGALFLTVGWMAMAPVDPLGPVCVLTSRSGIAMLLQAGALSAVCALVCTLIAGRSTVDVGMFASSIGLGAVSLRGGTSEFLLLYGNGMTGGPLAPEVVAVRFAVSSVAWFLIILLSGAVSMWAARWCFASTAASNESGHRGRGSGMLMCTSDIPTIDLARGAIRCPGTPLADALLHLGVMVGVGLLSFFVLTAPAATRSIQHGQSCFFVFASVWLACYFAHRIAPVRSTFWSILGVFVVCLSGYAWSAVRTSSGTTPPNIPESPFMRVLPVQFISVGTATAIGMIWSLQSVVSHREVHHPGDNPSAS